MKVFIVNFHYLVDFGYSFKELEDLIFYPVILKLREQFLYLAEQRLEDENTTY